MSERQLEDARGYWPDLSFGEARDVAQNPRDAIALGLVLLARIAEALEKLAVPSTEGEA